MSSTMTEAAASEQSSKQVRIQLTTRHQDMELPENTGPLLVSTNLRRYALSTLVNTLIGTERPIPFEFLINGQYLRTSIEDFLDANGISAETTLTVEYVRALIPPPHLASFEHDDWVSCVDVLSSSSPAGTWASSAPGHDRILSGSYDGLLRVWNMSSEVLATSSSATDDGHTLGIKAIKFISPTQIVSSGLDRTLRLWKYAESSTSGEPGSQTTLTTTLALYGHKASVDALAVHGPSSRILSASADHTLSLWSTSKASAPPAPETLLPNHPSKRRKLNHSTSVIPTRGPLSTLTAHTAPVSSTIFAPNDQTVAYSTSWDHTLRTWDITTSALVDTRTTSHALLSVCALPSLNLLAAGTSARHIAVIDPRVDARTISAMILRGHTNAVVSLATQPDSEYGLVSGSHDGMCRIWDIRSVRPGAGNSLNESNDHAQGQVGESVYVIPRESGKGREGRVVGGEGVKVLEVCWDRDVGIVSAGEDKRVQINRAMDLGGDVRA